MGIVVNLAAMPFVLLSNPVDLHFRWPLPTGMVLDEYSRLTGEVKQNPSTENIEAKNAARPDFEAVTHLLVNINIKGNKVVIGNSFKADAASIIAELERDAPGSTQ